MSNPTHFDTEYRAALHEFLDGAGEDALSLAYEIGRSAMASGLGLINIASIHNAAVADLIRERRSQDPDELINQSGAFIFESLSPFEMRYRAVDDANAALRRFNELLEEEARRIAHSLHDQAGSILASARLELDMASKDFPETARESLTLVSDLLEQTGEQMRHLSHELRPVILDDLGIGPAISYLAEGIEQRTGLIVTTKCKLRERLARKVESAIYRIVQEAINNAVIHGGELSSINVSIVRYDANIRCLVEDDGDGFDAELVKSGPEKSCLGLLGMRERAHAVNGICNIRSCAGKGTKVELVIPVPKSESTLLRQES